MSTFQRTRFLLRIHLALGTRIAGPTSSVESSAGLADVAKVKRIPKAKNREDFASLARSVKRTPIQ